MNYYIQGDAAKADKIKAAFEKLGYDTTGWKFNVEGGFYYTTERKRIDLACGNFLINLIKTHPDYQELELPVEPKFKVGDKIIWNEPKGGEPSEPVKIIQLIDKDQLYMVDMSNGVGYVAYDMQDYYKLVQKPHYAIANFKPFDKVLVRDGDLGLWKCDIFSDYYDNFYCFRGTWEQCIPFNDDTKHLLGTTDMCDEKYINW